MVPYFDTPAADGRHTRPAPREHRAIVLAARRERRRSPRHQERDRRHADGRREVHWPRVLRHEDRRLREEGRERADRHARGDDDARGQQRPHLAQVLLVLGPGQHDHGPIVLGAQGTYQLDDALLLPALRAARADVDRDGGLLGGHAERAPAGGRLLALLRRERDGRRALARLDAEAREQREQQVDLV